MKSGIYSGFYAGPAYTARGVFVIRNGSFFGVGQVGARYEGSYWVDKKISEVTLDGCVRFPPNIQLVTGPHTGEDGLTVPFKGKSVTVEPELKFVVYFAGHEIDLTLSYQSPVPG